MNTTPMTRLLAPVGLALFALAGSTFAAQVDSQRRVAGLSTEDVGPSAERFREVAAERLGVVGDALHLEELEGPIVLSDAGLTLYIRKAVDGERMHTVVALDEQGKVHDLEAAFALDRGLAEQRRGKLTIALDQELRARPGESLDVMVWIDAPSVDDLRRASADMVTDLDRTGNLSREIAEFHQAELTRTVSERIAPLTDAFAERMRAESREVLGADELVPVVFLRLSPTEIGELLRDPGVLSIDYAGGDYGPRLDVARGEVRADFVHVNPAGNTGEGVRVGIIEGTRVCTSNPYLTVSGTRNSGGPTGAHTTGVASCVKSTHPTHRGIAPGAQIYSANGAGNLSNSAAAINWAVGRGCRILNLSYGAKNPGPTVTAFDRYLDSVVRSSALTIAIACGNSGNAAGYAGDPGAGYNAIAVGNFTDQGNAAWLAEGMASSSSWRNPTTGVETPQVAAPGVNIRMLSCDGGINYQASGTSFSSPIVAGVAALMMSEKPVLGSCPEAVRAILMATAWHNIEGASELSSKDGAGGVDAKAAWAVASRGADSFGHGVLTSSSFSSSGLVTVQRSWATAGQTVRCALSWDSTPSGGAGYDIDVLKADFDLYVYRPDGLLIAISSRALQPFEILKFTAPVSGHYTLKIMRRSFLGTTEFYGTAMTTNWDM